ncbi:ribosome biogenesis GTP-binding protein YihA/YsxC [Liquorilactobacillus satsumensis]|uniref:Probable GTP-binding protein EngB n=1 Tax=Liquorilactobacillus satsumensis DSM 16230 = JCM 12392 TaxID=1423801 RepID=A0A0R1VD80_9LACO|nr:ribosome biogenesis GTP-binding protein YihA/YsxC [Liquorilactobacillus satsumensis]KRL99851.1 GTP-binding protein [Liquorilactobacillus satsumensis DSM 16230 = JCM 12392]MCC7665659.1 YihA family ribosome biogenesis GTP-binding protein [Liquorilactobacillus satsumensis]MCP9311871.1 YihA family ribosome biogenesis GTP-binding protein [Liquorilactobacillus satsumensis]MCP9328329.1 YihA family ribosome biogenesis GTP-binding protein [Liquorilactobacillus satsumensis]MCP9356548.1 YihA family ri
MKVHNVSLKISAVGAAQYPLEGYPEIALVGRSNVGKSSLVNTLINRRSYARTSSQPGKTQTLNFYEVESQLFLVDVPGYGYAKVSKKDRQKWGRMIEEYLTQRQTLRGVIILLDGRHAPMQLDLQMIDFLHYYKLPLLIVATKVDKVPRSKWNKIEKEIKQNADLQPQDQLVLFSATTKAGAPVVWDWIEKKTKINEGMLDDGVQ